MQRWSKQGSFGDWVRSAIRDGATTISQTVGSVKLEYTTYDMKEERLLKTENSRIMSYCDTRSPFSIYDRERVEWTAE